MVRQGSYVSKPFNLQNGLKQGCVVAQNLFSVFFIMKLNDANSGLDDNDAVYIRYRLDSCFFNLRCLKAYTKTSEFMARELLFPYDAALLAPVAYLHSGKCGIFQGRRPQRGGKFESELQLVIIRFKTSNL